MRFVRNILIIGLLTLSVLPAQEATITEQGVKLNLKNMGVQQFVELIG